MSLFVCVLDADPALTGRHVAATVGDRYPSANILGIDLSHIQHVLVPPNVSFLIDDVEDTWLYPRDHFDYIHARHTVMAIRNWPRLLRRSLVSVAQRPPLPPCPPLHPLPRSSHHHPSSSPVPSSACLETGESPELTNQ